jgi:hypothetical protein
MTRRAGTQQATSATPSMARATEANTTGSLGPTPNKTLLSAPRGYTAGQAYHGTDDDEQFLILRSMEYWLRTAE